MIERIYDGKIKKLSVTTGLHSYLLRTYNCLRPYGLIKTFGRQQLRDTTDTLYPFSTAEQIEISPPQSDREAPEAFNKVVGTHVLEQPFVAEIEDGHILDRTGIATTNDYTILLDSVSSREGQMDRRFELDQVLDLIRLQRQTEFRRPDTNINAAVSLIRAPFSPLEEQPGSKGYSHWVQCYLTLLQGIQFYEDKTGTRPTILLEPDPPSWILESLHHFGYDSGDIYFWEQGEQLDVERLVVPSVRRIERTADYNREKRGAQYKILSPNACKWLRQVATARLSNDNDDLEYSSKIFVSRADADRRQIRNRDEVMEFLREHGFRSYELSSLTFSQQVRLFSQADNVVGVHGAGLANLMFASDCAVTEVFGGGYKPTYYILSEILGLDYQYTVGKTVDDANLPSIHRDIKLPIGKLVNIW